ncbi:MAG: selenite/tellurite reduction operon b-type cytochrome membrane protein ExtQ [Thermoanaerobaculia bacterium]
MSRVPASPYFFRPVKRALLAGLAVLALLAVWFPAPLEVAANPAKPPNPAKSAWFLVWIQELVSYSNTAIWIVVAMAALLVALPWLPLARVENAAWFQRRHRPLTVVVVLASIAIAGLTIVGLFFRGADWCFALPF